MNFTLNLLIGFIALEHICFLILEMFLWTKPIGMKVFSLDSDFASKTSALAANQGLYNGFLAAGLFLSLTSSSTECSFGIKVFFLACVLIAGVYGGYSVSKAIFFVQALPSLIAIVLLAYLEIATGV